MTIPASRIVTVNPSVITTGGNPLVLNGLFLTENTQMPTATVKSFASSAAVAAFFGPASAEALAAPIYFGGFTDSTVKPTSMLFAPYNVAARAAFIQSGSLAGMTLTQLQALSGTLILTVNGTLETSSSISLSAATSFSNAATIIEAGFTSPPFTTTWNSVENAFVITSSTTGASSTVTFATGTLSTALKFATGTGAFLSQGAVVDTPTTGLANALSVSQNFGSIVTLFEPTLTDKEAFATANATYDDRFLYIAWDSDANASVQGNTASFGAIALLNEYDGVICLSGDPAYAAAQGVTLASLALNNAIFLAGAIASVNFGATNGRRTFAFLASTLALISCANDQISQNLLANGYSYYGSYATANQGFVFFYNGQMPGQFSWGDSYIGQIYLNAQLQLANLSLITGIGSIPYNQNGYSLIRAAFADPIAAAINFGTIRVGVTLSALQIAELNQQAGVNAAQQVQNLGYYLQILDPGAQVRGLRQSPIINFWYADGGSIQQLTIASIDIL